MSAEVATTNGTDRGDSFTLSRKIAGQEVPVRFERIREGNAPATIVLRGQTLPIYRASWAIKGRDFDATMALPVVDGKEVWDRLAKIDLDGVGVWARIVDSNVGGKPQRVPIGGEDADVRIASWTSPDGTEAAIGVVKQVVGGVETWERLEAISTPDGTSIWVRPEPLIVDDARVTIAADGRDYEVFRARWSARGARQEATVIRREYGGQAAWERLSRVTVGGKDAWCRQIRLTIDGQEVEVPERKAFYDSALKREVLRPTTIYDAAAISDGDPRAVTMFETRIDVDPFATSARPTANIPVLCHRDHLEPAAVCRVCVVDLNNNGKLVPSCQRQVEDGMNVSTYRTSRRVDQSVKTLLELLMADHPSPCEKQKQHGDCELETLAARFAVGIPRFAGRPEERPRDDSSVVIRVDHNACILCDRCIRGCDEIRENHVLGRMNKGYRSRIAFDLDDPMGASSCVACGECAVSCPTGALTTIKAIEVDPWADVAPRPEPVAVDDLLKHPIRAIRRAFRGVSRPFLHDNRTAIVRRRFRAGEVICREGDFGSTAFLIESGKVQVELSTPRKHAKTQGRGLFSKVRTILASRAEDERPGESHIGYITIDAPVALKYSDPIAILKEGDIFGEMTCMNFYPRSATVRAAEDCTVLEMLRNVLYIMQRSSTYREQLEQTYKDRAIANHLRSVELFAGIRDDEARFRELVDRLRPKVRLRRFDPGETIFKQGAPADDGFYLVRTGFVKVAQSRVGGDHVLSYIGPGGYFGEIGLLSDLPKLRDLAPRGVRTATCSALDHVDVVQITADQFRELVEGYPEIAEPLVNAAIARLEENRRALASMEDQALGEFLQQGLMNAQSLLVLDLEKCTRCDECTKACADAHDGVTRLIREGLRFDKFLVASSCRSCLDPYCMVGCPVGAIGRRNSREILIADWCIGCGKCAENCPYGNINMHPFATGETAPDPNRAGKMIPVVRQKATMCDLCASLDGTPSCVYACPHDAAHRMSGQEMWQLVQIGGSG